MMRHYLLMTWKVPVPTKQCPYKNTDPYLFMYVYRDDLTSNLPVLEYRHSSDDEVFSVDDMDSTCTYETVSL